MRRRIGLLAVTLLAMTTMAAPALAKSSGQQPAKKATVRQVAAVVAQDQPNLLGTLTDVQEDCLLDCTFTGTIEVTTIGLQAKTLAINLRGIDDRTKNNRLYIGTIPKELRPLVRQTLSTADEVGATSDTLSLCLKSAVGVSPCARQLFNAQSAWRSFERQLHAWDPYI